MKNYLKTLIVLSVELTKILGGCFPFTIGLKTIELIDFDEIITFDIAFILPLENWNV